MIEYSATNLGFIFRCSGSVFPNATKYALPNAILAVLLHYFLRDHITALGISGMESLWSGYTFVLGFLVVFRNNQAYSRFWEGANAMSVVRSEFLNGIGSALSFCDPAPEMKAKVDSFQAQICKLGSMLFASSVQQVCALHDAHDLQILSVNGLDGRSLDYLSKVENKPEIIMLWMERLVLQAHGSGVIKAAPPIVSRIYQEFGNGMVQLQKVRNIKEVPFPFPYAQMIYVMLIVHWLVTPFLALNLVKGMWWAATLCFFLTGSMWSLILIAQEIDMPFGEDPNDLPVKDLIHEFNSTLIEFMHPFSQQPPEYIHDATEVNCHMPLTSWSDAGQDVDPHTEDHDQPLCEVIAADAMGENLVDGAAVDVPCLESTSQPEVEKISFESFAKPIRISRDPHGLQQATKTAATVVSNSESSPTRLQATQLAGMSSESTTTRLQVPSSRSQAYEATDDNPADYASGEKHVTDKAKVNAIACRELAGLAHTQTPETAAPDNPRFAII